MAPSFLALAGRGELARRSAQARAHLSHCDLCPRRCGADRRAGEPGACGVAEEAIVAGYEPHFGEEAPLVGPHGSGAIFFAGCPLSCLFCQTREISQGCEGAPVSPEGLADIMLELQAAGCANINLVSGGHVAAQVLAALDVAARRGLALPIVLNSGGYEALSTLELLEGAVDIYLPDFKVWSEDAAGRLLGAADYPEMARAALPEMLRQVGHLEVDERGLARRGLIVRHLVLPGGAAGSGEVLGWIARSLGTETYLNLMGSYRPCGPEVEKMPPLGRTLQRAEYEEALHLARSVGLSRLDRTHEALYPLLWSA